MVTVWVFDVNATFIQLGEPELGRHSDRLRPCHRRKHLLSPGGVPETIMLLVHARETETSKRIAGMELLHLIRC